MSNALLVGLSRQVALARELDVVANNVANVNTNGFKRRATEFQEFVSPTAKAELFARPDQPVSFVWDRGTNLQYTQGAIETTGNPLDVAINGDALFVVRQGGAERYTRNGALSLNGKGELVNSDGYPIMSDQGPLTFTDQDSDIRVLPDGTVTSFQAGQVQTKGKLRLVSVANPQDLRNEGRNLFSSAAPVSPAKTDTNRLAVGAVERSNVKSVTEMTRLIEINRSYQAVATMMANMDALRGTAISRLADTQS